MAAYIADETVIEPARWRELTDEQLRQLMSSAFEDDRRWRASSAAEYRAVPGATIELLPGVGHSPSIEAPPRTAALLLAFTANRAPQAG